MIYLDNAATTYPKPKCVYDFADKFYRENGVYQGRGNYSSAIKVNLLLDETRELLLRLFNAPNYYKTIFTFSATIAINTVLQGFSFKEGMNVYISPFEHNSVVRTLAHIKTRKNINIKKIFENSYEIIYNIYNIGKEFQKNPPDVVIINHASNVFGVIAPIEEIFNLAKSYGALTILDASQTAGLVDIDLRKIKADCVIFAGHKSLYSPFGIAGIILNSNIKLSPLIFGGNGINSSDIEMPSNYPERLEAGSLDAYALAGLNYSLKWLKKISVNEIFNKEKKLFDVTVNNLSEISNVHTYIFNNPCIGIISFNVDGYCSDEVGHVVLSKNNIAVRTGLHCSPDAHKFIGTFPSGTVRISFSYFNTQENINTLIDVLKRF